MKFLKLSIIIILLLLAKDVLSQEQIVTGQVTEMINRKAEPMIGVNVNIMNAQNRSIGGVATDIEGYYRLRIPRGEGDITLVFSFIGMETQRIKYTGQKTLDVRMKSSEELLDEVVVSAQMVERNDMGISRKEMVSATQKIEMEDIVSQTPVVSVEEALQGRLGGVDIVMGGGDPGARSSIRIRGTNTLNASSDPLIVIDGIPYSTDISEDFDFSTANNEDLGALINIAPTDIESIEVLKDVAATAIWGTQGANGVLLITTKKGSSGKTNFSFSSKLTSRIEPKTIPMLNSSEYTALMQEAIWNSANYIGMSSPSNIYLRLLYDTPEIGFEPDWAYFNEFNQETDWLGEIRRNGLIWDNSFSMGGGGDRATYRLSMGYLTDKGTTIGTGLERLNTSLDINYQFSNKLKFGANVTYSQTDRDNHWASTVRTEAFRKMPNKSPYWIDKITGERTSQYFSYQTADFEGEFKGSSNYNPVAMANESFNKSLQGESKLTFRMDYKVAPGLNYSGWASINMRTLKNRKFLPQVVTGVVWTDKYANQSTDGSSDQMDLQTENKLIFIKNWERKHNLVATGVFRTSQSQKSSYTSTTSGNASSGLSDPIVGSTVEGIGSGDTEVRKISGIGLLNYTLMDRYVAQFTLTMEGNSAMGRSNRFGYFPTLGLSWNMQNEPFLANSKEWLDESKIRLSLGQSGRSPGGSSLYLGAFGSLGEYMDMSAVHPIRIQLDKLKWETSTEYNAGMDIGLFTNKLRFTFDYYQKHVSDLLQTDVDIPSSSGYASLKYFNSGELSNIGWEFRTDAVLYEKDDLRVSAYLNLNRNINKIIEIPSNMKQENYSFNNGNYATRVEEGLPLGSFFGYRYGGVYQNHESTYARDREGNIMNDVEGNPIIMKNGTATVYPGDAIYEDINHDGVINEYDIVYLGNFMPVVTAGSGISIRYKQLTLNAFFHGRLGQKIINATRIANESMYNKNNQSKAVLRRWRNEGDDTDIPRALYNEGYNFLGSDRFVEDASFVRLKTLSLTYSVPRKFSRGLGFNNMNFFVTGYDLITWTKYTGQDPEVSIPSKANRIAQDNANTPASIRLSCGVNLNF
ncbi:SusC/RagA family TonB-linked outer membrane protein [Proteiniphilum sp. UBA1028]|jgi:TonB-linked SusC/RagA family outer membrane protein|uniref:SusC/RagA family TonB-linked outer membrane protein n=1 Tax=Proteiniphilum sp. UBA1028 TaxID=1947251 RepID=UPI0025D8F7C6|nr:SusC/RagA family TonB-linked outer membrane protein [Proteiniphilum sp. UBA1028]